MKIDYPKKYVDILDKYLIEDIDEYHIKNIEERLDDKSAEDIFKYYLNLMDCTRWDTEHKFRLMQTIGVPYQILVSQIVYFVSNYIDIQDCFEAIKTRHENNLRYESENPPIIYDKKKINKIKSVKKERKINTERKSKQTKEEKKAAKFTAKFGTFSLPKIKL